MTNQEAIDAIKYNWPNENYTILREALNLAIEALENEITYDPNTDYQAIINSNPNLPDDIKKILVTKHYIKVAELVNE